MKGPFYYIITYDIEEKRVTQVLKIMRRYLNWVQNSVFEGELSDSQFEALKAELKSIIDSNKDSILIYKMLDKWKERECIGREKSDISNIL
ncbi:MAG: CRISPR-associated endonuclease Cas2 [Thermoflavifilum sp.]|nr:CRISPR-associated endonuclease Cas2 [Thermoflavifilum sp.]